MATSPLSAHPTQGFARIKETQVRVVQVDSTDQKPSGQTITITGQGSNNPTEFYRFLVSPNQVCPALNGQGRQLPQCLSCANTPACGWHGNSNGHH